GGDLGGLLPHRHAADGVAGEIDVGDLLGRSVAAGEVGPALDDAEEGLLVRAAVGPLAAFEPACGAVEGEVEAGLVVVARPAARGARGVGGEAGVAAEGAGEPGAGVASGGVAEAGLVDGGGGRVDGGGAVVEGHDDVGPDVVLGLDGGLGGEADGGAVDDGLEGDAVVVDGVDVGHGVGLVAAGVGEDGPVPAHEGVGAAAAAD